ncbi:hypothetical protein N7520_002763 [Penicillium odoratum]|uniref:uncharacterized protein n=1 Tax=Penicillium odoratum TaxID=1167516 RepID=UPI002548F530|nr:uncharacterized protein N7520_002763 [Penicillium odoratum]KAJ5772234.1 hypothetical protein N7520_002763 [Penicillium odoratum]
MSNADKKSIILGIITDTLQDADDNSYNHVVRVHRFMADESLVIGDALLIGSIGLRSSKQNGKSRDTYSPNLGNFREMKDALGRFY